MQRIHTAIILAAGRGTRRLPITRVIEKVMLPIGNRPTIDYVVEQCAAAGVGEIIFIVSALRSQVSAYYGTTIDVHAEYPWLGVQTVMTVRYIVQDESVVGYGTAAALKSAQGYLKDETSFLVLAGDGFIYNQQTNPVEALVRAYEPPFAGALIGLEVPEEIIRSTSLVTIDQQNHLVDLVEKPVHITSGQPLIANVSYYIFSPKMLTLLDDVAATNGEYYLTDVVLAAAKQAAIQVIRTSGLYLDSGQTHAWIQANTYLRDQGEY